MELKAWKPWVTSVAAAVWRSTWGWVDRYQNHDQFPSRNGRRRRGFLAGLSNESQFVSTEPESRSLIQPAVRSGAAKPPRRLLHRLHRLEEKQSERTADLRGNAQIGFGLQTRSLSAQTDLWPLWDVVLWTCSLNCCSRKKRNQNTGLNWENKDILEQGRV